MVQSLESGNVDVKRWGSEGEWINCCHMGCPVFSSLNGIKE